MRPLSALSATVSIGTIRNNPEDFAVWVKEITPYLRNQAVRVQKYHGLPSDLLNEIIDETVLQIQTCKTIPRVRNPSGWLYLMVRIAGKAVAGDYGHINHGDGRMQHRPIMLDESHHENLVSKSQDLVLEVRDLLEALPPDQAELLTKYLMLDYTQEDLAMELGISRATVGRLIANAMAAARRKAGVAA